MARRWSLPFELATSIASSHLLQGLECMEASYCSSHLLFPCMRWWKRRKYQLHSSSHTFKKLRSSKRGCRSKLFSKSPQHSWSSLPVGSLTTYLQLLRSKTGSYPHRASPQIRSRVMLLGILRETGQKIFLDPSTWIIFVIHWTQ